MIEFYADGACSKNPGPGGFGISVFRNQKLIEIYRSETKGETTNNRQELLALLKSLELAQTKYGNEACVIYSDSAYTVNSFNAWIPQWRNKGWVNSKNVEVENIDLMKRLDVFVQEKNKNFIVKKVSGHADVLGNEIADAVASKNAKKLANQLKKIDVSIVKGYFIDFY